jgi:hypothetical protein
VKKKHDLSSKKNTTGAPKSLFQKRPFFFFFFAHDFLDTLCSTRAHQTRKAYETKRKSNKRQPFFRARAKEKNSFISEDTFWA